MKTVIVNQAARRGLCVGLITSPEESECDCEASITRRPWPTRGSCAVGGRGGNHN